MMITRETGDRLDCGPSGLGLSIGRAARRTLVAVPTCRQRFPSPRRRAPARCNAGNATTFRNDSKGYNADNQLTSPPTFVYDGNGNPTTFSGTSLTFDPENRLTVYGSTLTAGYRGDNLRAWKQTSSGTTYFLYDGITIVCELDGSGSLTAQTVFGAKGLLSRGSVQYQFDPLGDATLLLDGSENVTAHRLFDAWGNELSSGSTDPRGYRARHGYYTDVETGLVALAYRYYAAGMGRFLNRDPIGYDGGTNVYAYGSSRALARIDPAGLAHIACQGSHFFPSHCWVAFTGQPCEIPANKCLKADRGPKWKWGFFGGITSQSGYVEDWGRRESSDTSSAFFEGALCECINESRDENPVYDFAWVRGPWRYVCYDWARDMMACAWRKYHAEMERQWRLSA